jgi:hypothetical protein
VRAGSRSPAALAVAILLAGCGTARTTAPPPAAPTNDALAADDWLRRQPEGCALGQSGPTLKPTDAFREARRRARAALVTAVEKVQQKSAAVATHRAGRDSQHEVILEQSEGWVRRSTIVALWYDDRGVGPSGAAGTAYAAACLGETAPEGTRTWIAAMESRRAAPAWLYGVAADKAELCAVGVAGPTMDPKDAPLNAEESAREELAEALAARIKLAVGIFQGDGETEAVSGAVSEVSDAERERAKQARIADRWTDARGVGPIPFPGTAYARACLVP